MSMIFKDRLSMGVTPVADTFIDNYMAAANGEYVKVYLYILRHQNKEDLSLEQIADALNHTEADVKRAINYWQKAGVLENAQENPSESILIEQNRTNCSMDIEVTSTADKETAAAQEEMGAMIQIGAAVASMIYASFALETLCVSVTGRITEPTVRQLK